jgi:hypothetical protein
VLNTNSTITANFGGTSDPVASIQMILTGTGKGDVGGDNGRCQNFEIGFSVCTSFYAVGSQVTLQGRSPAGNRFNGFSGGTADATGCATTPCIFTLSTNSTVTADFSSLTSIAVLPSTATLNTGQIQTFTATGTFSNGTTRSLIGNLSDAGLWRSQRAMSIGRFALAAAAVNDRLYAIGGSDGVCLSSPCGFAPIARVEMYDHAAGPNGQNPTWTTMAPMLTSRLGPAVAVVNNKIYAMGGQISGGSVTASTEVYDPVANTWAASVAMPTGRVGFAAAVIGNIIYAVGGGDPTAPLAALEAFDPATNTWTALAPMPTARRFLAAAAVNGKLYAIGGVPNGARVEEYDPALDAWTTKAPLPTARGGVRAVAIDGLIYAVGGQLQPGPIVGTVDVYNPASDTWANLSPTTMTTPRTSFAVAVFDGRLWAVGGQITSADVTSSLEAFRPPEVTWWSSNTAVATINQVPGTASAVGAGTTTLNVRSVGIDSGVQSATLTVNPAAPTVLRAPSFFSLSGVSGNTATFTWLAPSNSIAPTEYVLEGGIEPGQVLGTVPTGSTATIFSVTLPTGVFYVRLHSVAGTQRSGPSNEIRVFVNVPAPPSAPTGLLGSANGSQLALGWQNTFTGGAPTGIFLDVSGAINLSLPLGLVNSFTFNGVPPGTYNFAVRAFNSAASSESSNVVTLTFPGACAVPDVPTNLVASRSGNTINLSWAAPASGAPPTSYGVLVTGALNGDFELQALAASGTVGAGTYNFSVSSINACGRSAGTAVQTVVVP